MVKKKEEVKEENKVIDANVVTEERTNEIKKDGFKIGMVIVIIAAILFIVRFIFAILILSTALVGVVADAEEEYGRNNDEYGYFDDYDFDDDYDYDDDYDEDDFDLDDFGDLFDQFESYLDKHNYENYDTTLFIGRILNGKRINIEENINLKIKYVSLNKENDTKNDEYKISINIYIKN